MGSCYVLDRRWRYSVEKGSFATLVGHWRAGHRMASRCGEPDALLLFKFIGQPRFDEIGVPRQALGIAVVLSVRLVKSGAVRRPLHW